MSWLLSFLGFHKSKESQDFKDKLKILLGEVSSKRTDGEIKRCFSKYKHIISDIRVSGIPKKEKKKLNSYIEKLDCCFTKLGYMGDVEMSKRKTNSDPTSKSERTNVFYENERKRTISESKSSQCDLSQIHTGSTEMTSKEFQRKFGGKLLETTTKGFSFEQAQNQNFFSEPMDYESAHNIPITGEEIEWKKIEEEYNKTFLKEKKIGDKFTTSSRDTSLGSKTEQQAGTSTITCENEARRRVSRSKLNQSDLPQIHSERVQNPTEEYNDANKQLESVTRRSSVDRIQNSNKYSETFGKIEQNTHRDYDFTKEKNECEVTLDNNVLEQQRYRQQSPFGSPKLNNCARDYPNRTPNTDPSNLGVRMHDHKTLEAQILEQSRVYPFGTTATPTQKQEFSMSETRENTIKQQKHFTTYETSEKSIGQAEKSKFSNFLKQGVKEHQSPTFQPSSDCNLQTDTTLGSSDLVVQQPKGPNIVCGRGRQLQDDKQRMETSFHKTYAISKNRAQMKQEDETKLRHPNTTYEKSEKNIDQAGKSKFSNFLKQGVEEHQSPTFQPSPDCNLQADTTFGSSDLVVQQPKGPNIVRGRGRQLQDDKQRMETSFHKTYTISKNRAQMKQEDETKLRHLNLNEIQYKNKSFQGDGYNSKQFKTQQKQNNNKSHQQYQHNSKHKEQNYEIETKQNNVITEVTSNEAPVELAQEAKEEPLQILDVHQYFRDDYDINSLKNIEDIFTKIKTVGEWARRFENQVFSFKESKDSLEYFVLDEKLMRLIEALDRIQCHGEEAASERKIQTIKYINDLHGKLDELATDE